MHLAAGQLRNLKNSIIKIQKSGDLRAEKLPPSMRFSLSCFLVRDSDSLKGDAWPLLRAVVCRGGRQYNKRTWCRRGPEIP
jgi:hypothetical protein